MELLKKTSTEFEEEKKAAERRQQEEKERIEREKLNMQAQLEDLSNQSQFDQKTLDARQ